MIDPEQLKASKAPGLVTRFERRLLTAADRERPSPELTNRMRLAVGLSTSGLGATALASTKTAGLAWISAGIVAAAIVGGAVGVWTSARRVASAGATRPAAPVACAVPTLSAQAVAPEAAAPARAPFVTRQEPLRQNRNRPAVAAPLESSRGDLREEIALVDEARTALREQSPRRSLALLRRYAAAYPDGTFGPEAEALRVEALDASGQRRLAQSLARDFVLRHPESPLAGRVERSIDDRP